MQHMTFGALEVSVIDPHRRDTQYIYDEIFVEELYRHPRFTIPASPTFIDVGANIGLFCIWAHQVHRAKTIHAFEASPQTYAYLQDNVQRLIDPKVTRVRAANVAVSSVAGQTLTLHQSPLVSGISTLLDKSKVAWVKELTDSREIVTHQVITTTLSTEFASHDIATVDLLKIDVEGFYMEVLRGLSDADFAKIRNAVVEIEYAAATGNDPDEVARLLRAKGMSIEAREQTLYAWRD